MNAEAPLLTFVIPCLNEASTISGVIADCQKGGEQCQCSFEVVIADNGSTDGSQVIARSHGSRVINVPDRGYGAALLAGIKAAKGAYILMGDADSTYELFRAAEFIQKLQLGYDLVMGNRFQGEIEFDAMPFLHKYLGNPVLSALGRLFFGITIGDFHCGLRAFNRDAILALNLNCSGMEFASEMIIKSSLADLKITEIPTNLRPNPPGRTPHLRTWQDGWRHLKYMLSYSPKYSFLPLALILFLAAIILIFSYATQSFFLTGPNTLIFSFSCLVAALGIISDYLLTREMVYYKYLPKKTYSSNMLDYVLGLRKGTDRLFKLSAGAFVGSIFSFLYLIYLAFQGLSSVPAAGIAGFSACGFILVAFFSYLTAAKISSYRSIHCA